MINKTSVFTFSMLFMYMLLSSCTGEKTVSDNKVEEEVSSTEIDADGDWRLVSYHKGHETRVYGKNNDYLLTFYEEDNTFDFSLNNDTVDGEYAVVNDTIRFFPDNMENDNHDEVLMMIGGGDCYACQSNDSIVILFPDEGRGVFTRK